ncbi:NADP-dependent phosphogluconate dehydrogenase [Patescibacteria group bacterium]|nr:NADP-dependent phosphogluconate dehydrogenase [Patescibacteria group bacterium]
MKNNLGVIGLATMGANLAQNLADHNFRVAIYNRTGARTEELIKTYGKDRGLVPFYNLKDFIASLEKPRVVLLMVQAGAGTDAVLEEVCGLLQKGDIVIDGGNSFFKDTIRREAAAREKGLNFVGMGVSGGEEGARRGPAIMPGGSLAAWEKIKPIFSQIAAKDFKNDCCINLIGANGAGHFVKMVHNAIEYVDMQLIAEIYWMMKLGLRLKNEQMAEIFAKWNKDKLNSYLIEITGKILKTKDKKGKYVLDYILDSAGNKGTGKWTSLESLDLGVPSFSISAAVFARYISAFKKERIKISGYYKKNWIKTRLSAKQLEKALYAAKILAYAQGYELIYLASKKYNWNINLKELSRIWQGGCIIRAKFLDNLYRIFKETPNLENILLSKYFRAEISKNIKDLREVAAQAIKNSLPAPAILSCLTYFDSIASKNLPANLLQAQRDFFGAHTFQKKVDGEFFHYQWE